MNNQILKFTLLVAGIFLTSATSHAACPQSNLAGTWVVYITDEEEPDSDTGAWRRCRVIVDRTGAITTGSDCVSYDDDTGSVSGIEPEVSGSLISAPATCALSGVINISDGDPYTIHDGQINKSKNSMAGVGTYESGHFTFRAIKW